MRVAAALLSLWSAPALADDIAADPNDYRQLLLGLNPGDRLILAAGEYAGLPIQDLDGADGNPIVITGPESGAPAIVTGRACCNTISIRNSSWVTIRHLEVDVRGELVDGLKAEADSAFAHHITIEHLDFYNFGQDQQIVGINTKSPAWNWIIRNNTIYGAGTGVYLGDSTGAEPFVAGLIEHNLIVDPIGYDMQIKHQFDRPAGIGYPTQAVTVIRHNVFMKATNASTGGEARPNLLVGHFPPSGDGSNDRYEIYGNLFYENSSGTEGLFQGEGRFTFHDNILVNTFGSGMVVRPQNGEVRDVAIYHNTFLVADGAVSISGGDGFAQHVVGNAVFAGGSPLSGGMQRDNTVESMAVAGDYVNNPMPVLGALDLHPSGNALAGGAIDLSPFSGDLDGDRDFNGTTRDPVWRGAYNGSGTNPGWVLAEEIKTLMPGMNNPVDGGTPIDGGMNMPVDGGTPIDSGSEVDTGIQNDAGSQNDASIQKDAGEMNGRSGRTTGGCTCIAEHHDGALMWLLLLIPLRKRLRQSLQSCF